VADERIPSPLTQGRAGVGDTALQAAPVGRGEHLWCTPTRCPVVVVLGGECVQSTCACPCPFVPGSGDRWPCQAGACATAPLHPWLCHGCVPGRAHLAAGRAAHWGGPHERPVVPALPLAPSKHKHAELGGPMRPWA
jgi:hypothetical protein